MGVFVDGSRSGGFEITSVRGVVEVGDGECESEPVCGEAEGAGGEGEEKKKRIPGINDGGVVFVL